MITESDNTATNILIDKLGLENINLYISTQGYKDTQLNRKMMDLNAIDKGNPTASGIKGYQYKLMLADSTIVKDYTELTTKSKWLRICQINK